MEIPSINLGRGKLPSALDMPSIPLKQPSAEMPIFPPVVIPPSNLKAPAGVKLEEAEKEAVLVVSPILRPWLAKLLRRASQEVRVLSYREVPDDQSIKIIQTIELEEKSENGVEE